MRSPGVSRAVRWPPNTYEDSPCQELPADKAACHTPSVIESARSRTER